MLRLSDDQWERIRAHFPEENIPADRPGRRPVPTRQVLEGVLWILNTGAQWHMLPQCYPNYKTVHRRFQQWCEREILRAVLVDLANELRDRGAIDQRECFIDATFASAKGARRAPEWSATIRGIGQIIQAMPLFRLQLLRGDQRIPFLYDEEIVNGAVRLKAGVAYCLRKFSTLVGALARNSWLHEVRDNPRNAYAMGTRQSLETFLFGDERVPLGRVRNVLFPVQEGRCFYCGGQLTDAIHVDHFLPWVLYPSNLGHDLVLADRRCNEDKSDLLADVSHLARWCARNKTAGEQLAEGFLTYGILANLSASRGIARWAYKRARATNSVTWRERGATCIMSAEVQFQI